MDDMPTLAELKAIAAKTEAGPESEEFKATVVLLASAFLGPNQMKLAKFTGYPRTLIAKFNRNLRDGGVWRHGRVCADWFDDEKGGVALILDTCVAVGRMKRAAA